MDTKTLSSEITNRENQTRVYYFFLKAAIAIKNDPLKKSLFTYCDKVIRREVDEAGLVLSVLTNTTVLSSGIMGATDNDLEFAVNSILPSMAA